MNCEEQELLNIQTLNNSMQESTAMSDGGVVQTRFIGPFQLLEIVAAGGMGVVYRAVHRETNEEVALKTVRAKFAANPLVCRRFETEFEAARHLRHPHIVRALDFGMAGAAPYLALEFVQGESLGDWIDRDGKVPVADAVRIIVQIADALQSAHDQGYIHRDVKPDNILVNSDGDAKLTDLGLVKTINNDVNLTCPLTAMGTPNFMAPEQFEDSSTVDCRTDVYALGATLYMAITGVLPFRTRQGAGHLHVLKKKLCNEIVPPSKIIPNLDEHIDFAIRRSLRADKEQRQQSCREFIDALIHRRLLTDLPEPKQNGKHKSTTNPLERRASVRYLLTLHGTCTPVSNIREGTWTATVLDISTTGIRMQLPRRFEKGTLLSAQLEDKTRKNTLNLVLRVVRVSKVNDDEYSLGCTYLSPLTNFELKALL